MSQINKVIGQIGVSAALIGFLSILACSLTTDSYSIAAQIQARADLALVHVGDSQEH